MRMRELKFRAWDKEEKKWLTARTAFGFTWADYSDRISEVSVVRFGNPDDIVVMQYTGLSDKRGKEIYEGDILEIDYEDGVYKVIWFEGEPGFALCAYPIETNDTDIECMADVVYKVTVVGNIYEHPELLKDGKT